MGAADTDSVATVDLSTATRKERQFQVVPVPGHFTRGRWKCWDYKDDKNQQQNDGEKEKNDSMVEVSTIVITASTTTPDLEGISQDTITTMESTPVKERETSTIVVTSIAPHPTPIHGTPVSLRDPAEMEELMNNSQFTHTVAEVATSTGQHVVVAVPNDTHIQQVSVGVVQQSLPTVASAPVTANMVAGDDDNIAAANGAPFPNIDNKIEQAMDLVKTHLTFAVREEIEVLRQNIVELEQKLTHLENENQFLRQYAPPEIVANLAPLAQQRPAFQSLPAPAQNSSQSVVTTPTSTASKIPAFCEATFANSLSNVVADVRQQIRNPNPQ